MKNRKGIGILLVFLIFVSIFSVINISGNANATSTYQVTFTESGLPPGTYWQVTFAGMPFSIAKPSVTFSGISNGSYSYTIGSVSGYTASPSSGTITVNGANVNQAITFTADPPSTYTVIFTENGLPSGTLWGVIVKNATTTWSQTNVTFKTASGTIIGSVSEALPNGTYYFNITGNPWFFNSTHGQVIIAGAAKTITINFIENFTLNITETGWFYGLPPGDSFASGYSISSNAWGPTISGKSYTSTKNYDLIKLPQGSYSLSFQGVQQIIHYTSAFYAWNIYGFYFKPNITSESITLSSNQTMGIAYTPYVPVSPQSPPRPTSGLKIYGDYFVMNNAAINVANTFRPGNWYYAKYNSTLIMNISSSGSIISAKIYSGVSGINSPVKIISEKYYNSTTTSYANITFIPEGPSLIDYLYYRSGYETNWFWDAQWTPAAPYVLEFNSTQNTFTVNLTYPISDFVSTLYGSIPNTRSVVTQIQGKLNITSLVFLINGTVIKTSGLVFNIPYNTSFIKTTAKFGHNQTTFMYPILPTFSKYFDNNIVNVSGFVTPHNALVYNIYQAYTNGTVTPWDDTTGQYNVQAPIGSFILFSAPGYAPKLIKIEKAENNLNVTLQPIGNFSLNLSNVFNYDPLIGGFLNLSQIPVNYTLSSDYIVFSKISPYSFYIAANVSYTNPIAPLNITIPVLKDRKTILSFEYNLTIPYVNKTIIPTSNYMTISYFNWVLDPVITVLEYPVAVITAPTSIAYDSAVLISGQNSLPAQNSTITNYAWKITGPNNQLYTEYGVTITQYFSIPGIYTITLTVTDRNGLTNSTTTSIDVVSANQDLNIQISYTFQVLSNGNYEYNVTVFAKDNVSISQFLTSIDSVYVNTTLVKQIGYEYIYTVIFNPNAFGYGNHTIKFEAINYLDGYNSLVTYSTFGSVDNGGLIAYLLGHIMFTIVLLFFVIVLVIFVYIAYRGRMLRKMSKARRVNNRKR